MQQLNQGDVDIILQKKRLLAFRDVPVHEDMVELIQVAELRQGVA